MPLELLWNLDRVPVVNHLVDLVLRLHEGPADTAAFLLLYMAKQIVYYLLLFETQGTELFFFIDVLPVEQHQILGIVVHLLQLFLGQDVCALLDQSGFLHFLLLGRVEVLVWITEDLDKVSSLIRVNLLRQVSLFAEVLVDVLAALIWVVDLRQFVVDRLLVRLVHLLRILIMKYLLAPHLVLHLVHAFISMGDLHVPWVVNDILDLRIKVILLHEPPLVHLALQLDDFALVFGFVVITLAAELVKPLGMALQHSQAELS